MPGSPQGGCSIQITLIFHSRPETMLDVGRPPTGTPQGPYNAAVTSSPKTLLIVYHTHTGGTLQMAQAAAKAAADTSVTVVLQHAARAGPEDLLAADGFIFATPENLAAISGMMKDFFDRSYYPVLERLNGRPYLILVCAGSDGSNAVRQIERIAAGWRLKAVAEPLIVCTNASTPEAILMPKDISRAELDRCAELGKTLAGGLELGIF
jgi:multimeric flavodoxin WrbA